MLDLLDHHRIRELSTPALVVDATQLDRNIHTMADRLRAMGIAFRPHAKTHKSIEIARRQVAAGAVGITVATIGEAEVFAAGGVDDIFIAFPVWAVGGRVDRLARLNERCRLTVGVDSLTGVQQLAAVAARSGRPVRVRVELDSGEHRTGVPDGPAAVRVVDAVAAAGLALDGLFTHGGHSYLNPDAGAVAAADEADVLGDAARLLRSKGYTPDVLSAGSTPSARFAERGSVTELRPGTFVFGDRQQCVLGAASDSTVALSVLATVVSDAYPGQVVLDAGAKVLSKDLPATVDGYGHLPSYPDAHVRRLYDHHAVVEVGAGPQPRLGEVVLVVPNHVCPVVNLASELVAVQADGSIERWPVDARAQNG